MQAIAKRVAQVASKVFVWSCELRRQLHDGIRDERKLAYSSCTELCHSWYVRYAHAVRMDRFATAELVSILPLVAIVPVCARLLISKFSHGVATVSLSLDGPRSATHAGSEGLTAALLSLNRAAKHTRISPCAALHLLSLAPSGEQHQHIEPATFTSFAVIHHSQTSPSKSKQQSAAPLASLCHV